jgi:hypothetical protein
MTQEGSPDYYELKTGCCLHCPKAHPGCLCYNCKCKSCYWYESAMAGDNPCELVPILKQESKNKW